MPPRQPTKKVKKTKWSAPRPARGRDSRPDAARTADGLPVVGGEAVIALAPDEAGRPSVNPPPDPHRPDINAIVAALLRDLASIQKTRQQKWGYSGAAAAVMALDRPLEALLQSDGTLEKIPAVGPSSTRIALEVLRTGESATAEKAVAESTRAEEIGRQRALRRRFLSRARVLEVLAAPQAGIVQPSQYLGDFQMHSV